MFDVEFCWKKLDFHCYLLACGPYRILKFENWPSCEKKRLLITGLEPRLRLNLGLQIFLPSQVVFNDFFLTR
jgi:hypothetical protein